MTKIYRFLILAFCLVGAVSCSDDVPEPQTAARTVLVYMAGDNSLSKYAEYNLELIEEGCSAENLNGGNMLVYVDDRNNPPYLYKIEPGEERGTRVLVREYEEDNSASPETLRSVIQEVSATYPAESMGLVLWSHGTAWFPANPSSYLRAFGQDGDDFMEIYELADALDGFHFDFLAFDACYMGSVEVAYELRNAADYLIASATEVIGYGFPYDLMIRPMFSATADVQGIAEAFYTYYNMQSGKMRSASIALVKNDELEGLADASRAIFSPLSDEELWAVPLAEVQPLEYYFQKTHCLYDMEDYVKHLTGGQTDTYAAFRDALDRSVIYKACTPQNYFAQTGQENIETFSGLSVYAPQETIPAMNAWYENLTWWKVVYNAGE